MAVKYILLFSLLAVAAYGQKSVGQNPCNGKMTCSECIQTPTCAWCSQPGFPDGKRCFQPSSAQDRKHQCLANHIWNLGYEYKITQYKQLSQGSRTQMMQTSQSSSTYYRNQSSSSKFEAVQIAPQRVSLKLRINEARRIKFEYAQAEDYPVDLYYLMDLSKSMEDDKENLSKLGSLLVENMRNITSNFRLGFGSFVDKVVMPYVSTVPRKLIHPCDNCAAPYGFQNVMPLSEDAETFTEKVKNAAVSGNLDAPEGGFDAIMQAVVCRGQIGWREKARRLLVFSTDAGFHYAGDGKLGGIIKPNDGNCHLDETGLYTHSTIQDYPSISQVNLKVKENAINVIFAVTHQQINIYNELRKHVEGATSGQLSNDSSNVVELVKDQYNQISSYVEMKDNATKSVKITYYSSGLEGGAMKQTNKCDGLKVGSKVKFEAEVKVEKCPEDPREWKQTFQIYPVGINESLIVDLEMLCDCPCERSGHDLFKANAAECSFSGTLVCGVCKCDSQHFGRKCECNAETGNKDIEGVNTCRPDNSSNVDCFGRGTCVCGVCECETRLNPKEVISGTYCECDNFSCDYGNGELCSGPDHGTCVCGRCKCEPGWTGAACDCQLSEETCISPINHEICSNHGSCVCGKCVCDEGEERYTGKYCERHPGTSARCAEFKECVLCQMYQKGTLNEEECNNCTFTPIAVDYVTANETKDEVFCFYYDDDGCKFSFVYTYNETGHVIVRAQEKLDCPTEVYILGIVLGVIAAIVLIGLALILLWKVFTTIHDRREFAKFEKERMMAKWDTGENPIYKQATSTFKNPTYGGK